MEIKSREDIIVLILFAIVGLIVPTAIVGRHFLDLDPIAWLHINWGRTVLGYIFCILSTAVCPFNFYTTILVPWLYEREHGSMKDFAHMSGLPMLGTEPVATASSSWAREPRACRCA